MTIPGILNSRGGRARRPNIVYLHAHDLGRYCQPMGYDIPSPHLGYRLNDYSRHLAAFLKRHGYETALSGVQHVARAPWAPMRECLTYDLLFDPHEANNLAGASAHAAQRDHMHGRLTAWMKDTEAPLAEGVIPVPQVRQNVTDPGSPAESETPS